MHSHLERELTRKVELGQNSKCDLGDQEPRAGIITRVRAESNSQLGCTIVMLGATHHVRFEERKRDNRGIKVMCGYGPTTTQCHARQPGPIDFRSTPKS